MADYGKILKELREEHDLIGEAIVAVERLVAGQQGKRRGRPPKWLAEVRKSGRKEGEEVGRARVH